MKKIWVQDAVGMELCHDLTEMKNGFKGAAFRRGHIIREEDIPRMLEMGKEHVFVWEENAGEVHEEDCARRFAAAAPVPGGHYDGPSEGKVLLFSDTAGMFRVDRALLQEINSIGDITVSCIPDHYPLKGGEKLASMRIVPLVTKEEQILKMEELLREKPLFRILPYRKLKTAVIVTGSEIFHGRREDKFIPVAKAKLANYPAELIGAEIVDDKEEMIVETARRFLSEGAELILISGGMSVDPDDVTPSSIRALGAEVVTYGLPSQPGNMTLVSYLGDAAILGVPGAAVALPTTVFDVVLPQIFTGERFTKEELYSLAEGGLCQSCKECHWPNCTFGHY